MANDTFSPSLVCRRIISVLFSETVSPNDVHAVTITVIILSNPSDDRHTMPASSAYSISRNLRTFSSSPPRPSTLPVRGVPFFSPFSFFRWSCTIVSMMTASERKRFSATRSTAVKNMLNSSGVSTHPCLRPCPTSNLSEHSPSFNRTHACMPSWNWRMTADILGGTPKRARTSHRRVRSTESYALVRSINHTYKGVSFRASSCSRRTTNIMSTVERWGLNPHCSPGNMFSCSQ